MFLFVKINIYVHERILILANFFEVKKWCFSSYNTKK